MLDNMQAKVRAKKEPWARAFINYSRLADSSLSPTIHGLTGTAITASNAPQARADATVAYNQIIMWFITGNETYRANAISIIRSWSNAQSISSIIDEQIIFGVTNYKFAVTAEILRYSNGQQAANNWTAQIRLSSLII